MRKYQKTIIIAAAVIIVLGFCGVCAAMGSLLYYLSENPTGRLPVQGNNCYKLSAPVDHRF